MTSTSQCTEIEASTSGASIDLDSTACGVLNDGGVLLVSAGGQSRNISLAAGRDWLVARGSSAASATFIDVATGGHITLSLEDGSELSRHIPEGNTELSALFDAMRTAPPSSESDEDG